MPPETITLDIEAIRDSVSRLAADSYQYKDIHYFESLGSTNDWLSANGKPGDICIAEEQTAGKGRRGNLWLSPHSENIYFSIKYHLQPNTSHQSLLGLVVSIAIAEGLAESGISGHGIKWPNDIYFFRKKVGGVLIETNNQSSAFIIGVGLNYNLPEQTEKKIDQDVTSIQKIMRGNVPSRELLMVNLLNALSKYLYEFTHIDFQSFKRDWNRWDILRDEIVSFEQNGELINGVVTDLDEYGRLGILNTSKQLRFYSSADIRLNKLK